LNLQWAGQLEEAEEYFLKWQAAFYELPEKPSDRDRPYRADFFVARVQLLLGTLAPSDALPIIEAYINVGDSHYGDLGLITRALCLARLGQYREAEAALAEYDGTLLAAAVPGHYERRLRLSTLAEISEGLGDHEKAAEYRRLLSTSEKDLAE
ncbi:MAG: hypothetical protein ACYS0D_03875, partial [Planctomycetota bacterium]